MKTTTHLELLVTWAISRGKRITFRDSKIEVGSDYYDTTYFEFGEACESAYHHFVRMDVEAAVNEKLRAILPDSKSDR